MSSILYVRLKSSLGDDELIRRLEERLPKFREVPGLLQKIYARDDGTGYMCGIYFFETREALEAFAATDLARSIPDAYEVDEIRREVYEVMYSLHPDRGPFG